MATNGVLNSNVELPGRSGWKLFRHGVTEYVVMKRRIDGSWYMPMIRQLHVVLVDPDVTLLPGNMTLKMVLEDKQLPAGDPDKVVPVTLRSRARMWGAPRYDDVKVMVEGSPHGSYFAR